MRLAWIWWLAAPGWAAAQTGAVEGQVFWEADGSPPRFWVTVELEREGKVRHRQRASRDGRFAFRKVPAGSYTLLARFREIVFVRDGVVVSAGGPNFAVLMLPKLRAEVLAFATVSYDQLRQWASRESQKRFREAERRLERGDADGAVALLQEIQASTSSAGALDLLGLLHLRQGRRQEGRALLEQAIARDPKYLFPYSRLVPHLLAEGGHREAAAVARRALVVDREWAMGHLILGGRAVPARRPGRRGAARPQGDRGCPAQAAGTVSVAGQDSADPGRLRGRSELPQALLGPAPSALVLDEVRESIRVIASCLAVIPDAEPSS